MLSLDAATPDRWFAQVCDHLDELLVDHAHCEKKAAGVAMSLLFTYGDNVDLCRAMADIVQEELDHFQLVLDLLDRRGVRFRRQQPARYAERLSALIHKGEPGRASHRLHLLLCSPGAFSNRGLSGTAAPVASALTAASQFWLWGLRQTIPQQITSSMFSRVREERALSKAWPSTMPATPSNFAR